MPQKRRCGNPALAVLHCLLMQYFLGIHLTGEAGDYLHRLTGQIAERFGTWALHERVPPHITLFRPFDADATELEQVQEIVQQWLAQTPAESLTISGFDRFDDKVVFAAVQASTDFCQKVEALQRELEKLPQMPPERPAWHPHASVARLLPPEQIERIWEYVGTLEPFCFSFPVESVTVFHHPERGKWRPKAQITTNQKIAFLI